MINLYGSLKGYKTYIVCGIAVLTSLLSYLTGDATLAQASQAILTATIGATLRNALPS